MQYRKVLILLLTIVSFFTEGYSQELTVSPYSIFGIGEINQKGSNKNIAMGGSGIAMESKTTLNSINPSSYIGIDSLFFIYEINILTKYSGLHSESESHNLAICNLSSFALGFQAKNWWGISFGLTPFSNIGYNITTNRYMEVDNNIYEDKYIGSGGINQIYMGNSFKLFKNFSLGFNLSYLFGSLDEDEEISFDGEEVQYIIRDQNHVKGFYLDYGLLLDIPLSSIDLSIGAIFGHKRYLNSSMDRTIYDEGDNVLYSEENAETVENYIIPRKIGLGIFISKEDQFGLAFDYTMSQWSEVQFSNSEMDTKDSHKFSLGLEYSPGGRYSNNFFKSLYYRIGGYYNSSYLNINSTSINSMAITFGFGIPVNRNLSMFNIAFEIGKNGTMSNGLIKENFYSMNLNFSLQDIWFLKHKYD